MAKNSPDRPDDEQQHEDGSGPDDPIGDGGSGTDHQSPGRSLLDDDAEIVEPNEPA